MRSLAERSYILVGCLLAFTLGSGSVGFAQVGTGPGYIPGQSFWGATDPGAIRITEGFRLIPSVMVGERYDSNVFYVSRDAGIDREDFVTTTAPQVRGLYVGSLFSINATAGAVGEYYAKNPGLSYVGVNTGLFLEFNKLLEQWKPGSIWQVSENYSYTPQPPAFLTGDVNAAGQDAFVRGYQASRVNNQRNNLSTNISVPVNQTVTLEGAYNYGFIKFGESSVQQGALLDTTSNTYNLGLGIKVTPVDTFVPRLIGSQSDYGSNGSFTTLGGTLGWTHMFSQILSASGNAGFQSVETNFPGTGNSSYILPTGSANVSWRDNTTTIGLSYYASVTPSFQFQAAPLLTQTWSFALTQLSTIPNLVGTLGANYGRGDEYKSSGPLPYSYYSYAVYAGVTYKITSQTFLGINYSYSDFISKIGGNKDSIDRSVVQLTLNQAIY